MSEATKLSIATNLHKNLENRQFRGNSLTAADQSKIEQAKAEQAKEGNH